MPKGIAGGLLTTSRAPKSGPGFTPHFVKPSDKRIYHSKFGSTDQYNVVPLSVKVITADTTLTAADEGKLIVFDSTTSLVVSLPATAKNLTFWFYVKTAAGSGAGHSISPVAADKIYAKGFTAAANKDAINTQATGAQGDAFSVIGNGTDGWFGYKDAGTWAREA